MSRLLLHLLEPISWYLQYDNAIELTIAKEKQIAIETINNGYQLVDDNALDKQYWGKLCYVLANEAGIYFDEIKNPRLSTHLPGGHRFEALLGSNVGGEISISIRLKRSQALCFEDFGLKKHHAQKLQKLIKKGANIVISGGTSSGKTSFLNMLLRYVPKDKRVLTIEDTREIDAINPNISSSYVLERNNDDAKLGYPEIIDHMVRSRPDIVICGEISVKNAFPVIRVINSGHKGFMCTIHANTPHLALKGAFLQNITLAGYPAQGVEELLYRCIDVVIQLEKKEGYRLVSNILYLEGDNE